MIHLINSNAVNIPLPASFAHMMAFSPPYFGLRKYKAQPSQWPAVTYRPMAGLPEIAIPPMECVLGNEEDPLAFVGHMVLIMREARRVLRDDGTVWLNFGDSYVSKPQSDNDSNPDRKAPRRISDGRCRSSFLEPKNLMGIPWRVAFALQADGWYLRSDVIWSKVNPMPNSQNGWRWERHQVRLNKTRRAKDDHYHALAYDKPQAARDGREFADQSGGLVDCPGCDKCAPNGGYILRRGSWRPTSSHEHIFLLAKSGEYYADKYAVTEPLKEVSIARVGRADSASHKNANGAPGQHPHTFNQPRKNVRFGGDKANGYGTNGYSGNEWEPDITNGRNKWDVWQVATKGYPGSHFAVWPPELVEPMIKASTSEAGCCPHCGQQWARVVEKGDPKQSKFNANPVIPYDADSEMLQGTGATTLHRVRETTLSGWRQTCSCPNHSPVPCVVVDLFCGSGTTLEVARQLGRNSVGLDVSHVYLRDEATKRLQLDKIAALENGTGLILQKRESRKRRDTAQMVLI